jgi:hypothetical protein
MDRLEPFRKVLAHGPDVFSGQLCGITGGHESEQAGHLHVLKKGAAITIMNMPNIHRIRSSIGCRDEKSKL